MHWQQVAEILMNSDPEIVEISVPQPLAVENYYDVCASVDQHNQSQQDNLQFVRKIHTKSWEKQVNFSNLTIAIVNAWYMYSGSLGCDNVEDEKDIYEYLFEDMIDNDINNLHHVVRACHNDSTSLVAAMAQVNDTLHSGTSTHLTPTKCKQFKMTDSGTKIATTYIQQGCSALRYS